MMTGMHVPSAGFETFEVSGLYRPRGLIAVSKTLKFENVPPCPTFGASRSVCVLLFDIKLFVHLDSITGMIITAWSAE